MNEATKPDGTRIDPPGGAKVGSRDIKLPEPESSKREEPAALTSCEPQTNASGGAAKQGAGGCEGGTGTDPGSGTKVDRSL